MSAEDAYDILEAIAEIHEYGDRLIKWDLTPEDKKAEAVAEEVFQERHERMANFSFSDINIPIGAELEYVSNQDIKCTVIDTRRIEYMGQSMYITPFVKLQSGKNNLTQGPKWLLEHFMYNNILLKDRSH